MHPASEFLNPRAKLFDEVAGWLKDRARDLTGTKSLAPALRHRPDDAEREQSPSRIGCR